MSQPPLSPPGGEGGGGGGAPRLRGHQLRDPEQVVGGGDEVSGELRACLPSESGLPEARTGLGRRPIRRFLALRPEAHQRRPRLDERAVAKAESANAFTFRS